MEYNYYFSEEHTGVHLPEGSVQVVFHETTNTSCNLGLEPLNQVASSRLVDCPVRGFCQQGGTRQVLALVSVLETAAVFSKCRTLHLLQSKRIWTGAAVFLWKQTLQLNLDLPDSNLHVDVLHLDNITLLHQLGYTLNLAFNILEYL